MRINPKSNTETKKRILVLLSLFFLVQVVIVGRYAFVQIVDSPRLQRWAVEQWTNDTRISAKRGDILDRNGNPLAVSGNVERVDAFLRDVKIAEDDKKITKEEIAEKLSPILDMSKESILNKLNKKLPNGQPMSSVTIARRIEKEQGNKIRELNIPGMVVTEDTKRYYPNGNFLAHVIGNTNIDGDGRAGLELKYNDQLKGVPGRIMGETDMYRRELASSLTTYQPPQNGNNLVLTIDQSIQYFVEKAIEKGVSEYKAKQITCLVMDPKTGEVLAMANKPDYDPNNPVPSTVEEALASWSNRAVSQNFEPGSILKVITAAAAMEENKVSMTDKFNCTGSYRVADRNIHCWKRTGHGVQEFPQILQNSCNVGFMILGERLGKEGLNKYFNAFGLGKKTGIDLPGEEKGIIMSMDRVGKVELANQAFGQGVSVTPIQYLTAFSAVANNGMMMQPHVVKEITNTDENGNTSVVETIEPKKVKQVISEKNAKELRGILETVVSVGGGKKAYIPGYHIAGKTGTAQKAINGVYAAGKYVSSFTAMVPSNDPRFTILVSIDEPDPSNYYSGSTAGPIAKEILEDIVRYLNIQPDPSDTNVQVVNNVIVPEVRGMDLKKAKETLKNNNLDVDIQGAGTTVADISPKPGISAKENTKVTIYTDGEKEADTKIAVPDFTGMTVKEIKSTASMLGLQVSFIGDGIGASQDVEAKKIVDKNTAVSVMLEQPDD